MKIFFSLIRILLAFMLVFFGLNKFYGFVSFENLDGFAAKYIEVMSNSYIFPTVGGIYLVAAVLLVSNRIVGLAVLLTFPIALNALLFHMTLDPSNMQLSLIFVLLHLVVMFEKRRSFIGLFS